MTSITLPAGAQLFHLPVQFPLEHGGALTAGQLAFELDGPDDAPVVCVLGGISADRHVATTTADSRPGWWEPFVGAGRAVDARRYRVLGIDYLGGVGGSTGPVRGQAFPSISPNDQASALAALCDHLGIERLHAIVGASYGGMVGLAFAVRFGRRLERLVTISAPAESHPLTTAWRSLQRDVVRLGIEQGTPERALALARGFAMTSYRSAAEFAERFAGQPVASPAGFRFPVDSYLSNRGDAFVRHISAERFLCLCESLDLHAVDPRYIDVPTTVIGVPDDRLVPFAQLERLVEEHGGDARLCAVHSRFGHDAFLKEVDSVGAIVAASLDAEVVR